MKKIYILLLAVVSALSVSAQDFLWAKRAGLWAYDYGYGICTDAAGNVYVAGKYEENNAEFGDTTVPCAGNHDMFVAKYGPNGEFHWVRTGGGPMGDYAHAIACDASGNVYVAGEIDGPSMFGSVSVNANPGTDDVFVAKYDTNGNLIWVKSYGGYHRDDARSIAIDAGGNSYICGIFRNDAFFGSTTLNAASQDIDDVFIAKLDPSGNVLWAKAIGGIGDDTGKGITVDAAGNAYVTGGFIGTANFGTTSLTAPNGYRDMYIGKWDTNGNLQWVKQAGGLYDDVGWGIAYDNLGSVYVTGEFNANASFDALSVSTVGNADVFVAKYDLLGNAQWVQRFGGGLIDRGRGITANSNNVFFTGQYAGTATHGATTITSADSMDIFVASFTSTGAPGWVVATRGIPDSTETLGFEAGTAVHVDAGGFVHVTGSYLTGDTLNWMFLEQYSRTDIFIAKIDPSLPPGTVGIDEVIAAGEISVFPNPSEGWATISFDTNKEDKYIINVTNTLGQVVFSEALNNFSGKYLRKLDLSEHGKGMYLLTVDGPKNRHVEKIVIY